MVSMPIIRMKNGRVEINIAKKDLDKSITLFYNIDGDIMRPENFSCKYTTPLQVDKNSIVSCYAISSEGYISYTNRYIVLE